MYICDNCGYQTEQLPTVTEHHPYGESYAEERLTVSDCPFCAGGELVPAAQCEHCDVYFADNGDKICPDCANKVLTAFDMFCRGLDQAQKIYLNRHFDGTEVFA